MATTTKISVVGAKRKAEKIKEGPSSGLKKPKIDSVQSSKPHSESERPKNTNAVAKRLISGTLGIPLTKNAEKPLANVKIGRKEAQSTSAKTIIRKEVKVQELTDSSDDEFDEADEDGGVTLNTAEETLPAEQQGIHPDRLKTNDHGGGPNGSSSKEAHAKQKQLVAERKASKPLAEQLARTKKIWERLRRKSHVPLEERKKLVEELFEIITGKVKDYVLKHDSVRVIQTAIKYANLEQKRLIAKELQGTYRQLAESRYAKFLIGKLLVQGDDEIRDLIVPEFFGNVRRLIKHPEASWILDDVYRGIATGQQKAIILREWYGAEFALFQADKKEKLSGNLVDVLAAEPGKRAPIMHSLQELINHLIQKKLTGFTLLHDAMLQYFLNCKPGTEEITDYIELIKGDEEGDLLKNLAFTKSGARVVCLALAYGTAKDRKHILKTYKDTLQMMAMDLNAHIIILTAYEVIDDTVLTAKSIFPELLGKEAEKQIENAVAFASDLYARTTLLYLFQGRSGSLFPASTSSDLAILSEIDDVRTITSKKDPEVRRQELIKALSPYLLKAISSSAPALVVTSFGCQFVTEVLFGADGDKSSALQAIAATAAGDPNGSTAETLHPINTTEDTDAINMHEHPITSPQPHVAHSPHSGKMFKALLSGGRYSTHAKKVLPVSPPLHFADILYPHIAPYILAWAMSPSSFVVLNLLEAEDLLAASRREVRMVLKEGREALVKAASEETVEQRDAREERVRKEEGEDWEGKGKRRDRGKTKKAAEKAVGNQGARMILEILEREK